MVIVEMALEGIASTELLAAAPSHRLTAPDISLRVRWEVIIPCVLYRDPAANPLCRPLETSVSTDMAFEIRGAVVALHPFAVGTSPGVVLRYRGRRNNTRGRLNIAGMRGMTRSFTGGIFSALLLRRGNSGAGSRSSGFVPFPRAQSGRWNIFVLRPIAVTLRIHIFVGVVKHDR